ncbi:MAG: VanZ family protein [Methylocystis sp.]|uniref:VanZ family protein n=1 Tax=Methylocystis sp. TaxID=1911079 RepID=UPI003DA640AC
MSLSPRAFRLLAYVCVCVIIGLSLLPGPDRPHTGAPGRVEHFIAYAGTGLLFCIGFTAKSGRLLAFVGLAVLSSVMELLQAFVPGRSPAVLDAVASTAGAAVGLCSGALLRFAASRTSGRLGL